MSSGSIDRRRFHEWSAAALGGLVAGSLLGCSSPNANQGKSEESASAEEKHLCRGLNDCRGQGAAGQNECRGQGACATLVAHSCAGENACKSQGGCGENPGLNECKGQGGCSVPLMESAWQKVRARKEAGWAKAGEKFGTAPAKAESSS